VMTPERRIYYRADKISNAVHADAQRGAVADGHSLRHSSISMNCKYSTCSFGLQSRQTFVAASLQSSHAT
jgi:hypothetical protein